MAVRRYGGLHNVHDTVPNHIYWLVSKKEAGSNKIHNKV